MRGRALSHGPREGPRERVGRDRSADEESKSGSEHDYESAIKHRGGSLIIP